MSSFKDNFTRGQGDGNLQYDDTAFYYFAVSILSSVSFLLGIFIIRRLFKSDSITTNRVNIHDKTHTLKLQHQKKLFESEKYNFKFTLVIIFFFVCLYFAINTSSYITKKDSMKRFDPYEILEIPRGASLQEIKKAYRKQVLLYHPDKNPTAEAASKFLLVTKANECLTDETKKAVCEQFGSPDGPGSLQVAIAMPSFFQKKENHVFILALFSVFFVIFVPICVLIWLNSSQSKNHHGMLVENYRTAFQGLNQTMPPHKLIEILGFCLELRFPFYSRSEQEYYRKETQFKEDAYPQTKGVPATKGQKMLILHFENIPMHKESEKNFDTLMKKAPCIIESAIEHCLQLNNMLPKTDRRYISVQTLLNTIKFQQHFYQGVWSSKQEMCLSQLSGVQENKIVLKKFAQRYKSLKHLMSTPIEQRKYDVDSALTEEQKEQVIKTANNEVDAFPNMVVQLDILLDEKDQDGTYRSTSNANKTINLTIEAGQIFNVKIGITRLNYPEKGDAPFALCHKYPYLKEMHMHIFYAAQDRIFQYQSLIGQTRYIEYNEKMALPEGEYNFDVYVKPDCYVGLDETFRFNLKVVPPKEKNHDDESDIHPEDIQKFKEPTFVQKLLGGLQDQQEEEEEEEEIPDISKNLGKANTQADNQEEEDQENEEEEDEKDSKKNKNK